MERKLISRRQALGWLGAAGASTLFAPRVFSDATIEEVKVPNAWTHATVQGCGYYRFKIGSFQCALVSDGGFTGEAKSLFPQVEPEEIESAARESFISTTSFPMYVNALLIQTGRENVLIDTGCGTSFGETAGKLERHLAFLGLKPDSISHIVITHAHGDHFGGRAAFPQSRFFTSKAEHDFWTGSADLSTSMLPDAAKKRVTDGARTFFADVKDRLDLIDGEKDVVAGVSMLPAPGHTPGHCAILINSGTDQFMYLSDTVHVQSLQMMHPEFRIVFDADPSQAEQTRRKLLDRAASERMLIGGSHLSFPALGHVRARSSRYEFVPELWQW